MIRIDKISALEAYKIRKDVLRNGIPLTEKMVGDFDESTLHFGVFLNDVLVCIASYMKTDNSCFSGVQYQLRGMATLKKYQQQGFGKKLILAVEDFLRKEESIIIWCNARVSALGFYEKLGFEINGTIFEIPLIGKHYIMFKEIEND